MQRDYADILRIYQGSDGQATMALYRDLEELGAVGKIAVNLFRACKCSERAKAYRPGRGYRTAAYERKNWSIRNLARTLHVKHAQMEPLKWRWGWAIDEALRENGNPHHHILYIDLPTGQVSFHTGARSDGPDYAGQWDGARGTAAERVCRFVASLGVREGVSHAA